MLVEPDAEIVQSYPARQPCSQPIHVVGPLPPQTEGVEEFVVKALYDLAHTCHPPPQAFGPGLSGVSLGRMDNLCSIALLPTLVVLNAFKAFVCHVVGGFRAREAHADESFIRVGSCGEEGLGHLLVGGDPPERVSSLVERLCLPSRLRDVGVPEHDLEDIARDFGDQRDDALAILKTSI